MKPQPLTPERGGQVIPSAPEAEKAVVALLLQFPVETSVLLREEQVSEEWFNHTQFRDTYTIVLAELHAGRRLDYVTLITRLKDLGRDDLGGQHLSELMTATPAAGMLGYYIDELREKFLARKMRALATAILADIESDWSKSGRALVATTQTAIHDLASYGVRNDTITHIAPLVMDAVKQVEYSHDNRGQTLGLQTGIHAFDRMTNGICKSFGYYILGRPAHGKSALMSDMVDFIATNADPYQCAHVLVFTLEMTGLQLVSRSLMKEAGIPQQSVRTGMIGEKEMVKIATAGAILTRARMHIDTSTRLTCADIDARTRRFVRQIRANETPEQTAKRKASTRPDIVVAIDYLQLVDGTNPDPRTPRYLVIKEVLTVISALWKELEIAGIVLAQLGRPDPEGPDHLPKASDARECGDIEAFAHVMCGVHRPYMLLANEPLEKAEKWCAKHTEEGSFQWRVGTDKAAGYGERDLTHLAYLCVLKNREGGIGPIQTHFEPALAHFSNWNPEEQLYSNNPGKRQTYIPPETQKAIDDLNQQKTEP